MDELLYERVKQLKEIDDRLTMINVRHSKKCAAWAELNQLRYDLADMIRKAEEEHAAF